MIVFSIMHSRHFQEFPDIIFHFTLYYPVSYFQPGCRTKVFKHDTAKEAGQRLSTVACSNLRGLYSISHFSSHTCSAAGSFCSSEWLSLMLYITVSSANKLVFEATVSGRLFICTRNRICPITEP